MILVLTHAVAIDVKSEVYACELKTCKAMIVHGNGSKQTELHTSATMERQGLYEF